MSKNNINSLYTMLDSLIVNREKFVDDLKQDYTYDNLSKIFNDTNISNLMPNKLCENKFLYRIMTSDFVNSKYKNSSINWIPSNELIVSLLDLARYFNITTIQEINAGLGLFSSLIELECNLNNYDINLITSDTFTNVDTCKQLDYAVISRKDVDDFRYYNKLNINVPEMIIFPYYPVFDLYDNKTNMQCIDDLHKLLRNTNHKIVIFITPITTPHVNTVVGDFAFSKYEYISVPIKIISKHDSILNYPNVPHTYSTIAHIFINRKLNNIPSKQILYKILDKMILKYNNEIPYVDTSPHKLAYLYRFYFIMSDSLLNDLYNLMELDYHIDYHNNNSICKNTIKKIYTYLSQNKCIPIYIEKVEELRFWLSFFFKNIYLHFDNRNDFNEFYSLITNTKKLNDLLLDKAVNLNVDSKILCICCAYLDFLHNKQQFKNDTIISDDWFHCQTNFTVNMKQINTINKIIISTYTYD